MMSFGFVRFGGIGRESGDLNRGGRERRRGFVGSSLVSSGSILAVYFVGPAM